jgi:hypothetical protein
VGIVAAEERRSLAPVASRGPWIAGGLALQLCGAGAPAIYVLTNAHHEDVGGQITKATLTLAWRQAVHSHAGLALLIGGTIVFALGSIVLARPFVKSWVTLFVAIPLAAIAGVLVLGLAAVIIALLIVGFEDLLDINWGGSGGGGGGAGRAIADNADAVADFGPSPSGRRRRRNDDD